MKLLAFSDIQGKKILLDHVIKTAKKENVDLLVCAGDLSDWGEGLEELIIKLKETGKPLIFVPGNHDDLKEFKRVCKKFSSFVINLNKGVYYLGDYCFLGYGEGVFEVADEAFESIINRFSKMPKKYEKLIIITHAPVYNTELDKIPGLGHVGSKSYRKAISILKPNLFISGHIHETEGRMDRIGNTLLINPGPVGRVIEI